MSGKIDGATFDQESGKEKKRKFKATLTTKLRNIDLVDYKTKNVEQPADGKLNMILNI